MNPDMEYVNFFISRLKRKSIKKVDLFDFFQMRYSII